LLLIIARSFLGSKAKTKTASLKRLDNASPALPSKGHGDRAGTAASVAENKEA